MSETKTLRLRASDLVAPKILKKLQRRSNLVGLALITHAWGMIFAAMALFYLFPNPLTFVLAVMIIGARQLGLAVLMHDAAHNALFRTTNWNNWLSDWLCGYPMMARTDAYRRYHLQHHTRTQQDDDPDLILSKPFPITRKSLRRKLWRDLSGQTGYQQRKAQLLNAFGPKIGIDGTASAFLVETGRRTCHPYGDFGSVQRAFPLELLSDVLASAFPDLSYGNYAAQKYCRARHCAR